eukprot:7141565-Karenia_brevis.AAC.1
MPGIGMTKTELMNNLDTIAEPGTSAFMKAMAAGGDISVVGQSSLSFYSASLISESMRAMSKHNDDE